MSSDNSDKKVVRMVNSLHDVSASKASDDEATSPENAVCQFCFGTGTRLEPDEEGTKGGIKGAAVCDCRRSNSGTRFLDAARIPPRFRECSFHNYYAKNDSQYFAHSFASRLVDEYPAVETGLLFMGTVGVGKTHLAIAVLKELIDKKGVACLFYESGSLQYIKLTCSSWTNWAPPCPRTGCAIRCTKSSTHDTTTRNLPFSPPTIWMRPVRTPRESLTLPTPNAEAEPLP